MIAWWEWLILAIIMIVMHMVGYYRLIDRTVTRWGNWWSGVKLKDRYEDLKIKLDMAHESEAEYREKIRDRLRYYIEQSVSDVKSGISDQLWYDREFLDNKIVVDTDMKLVICTWAHHALNHFYNELMDGWDGKVPLMSKQMHGYKVVNDWWVYFAGELYKTGDMIRHEVDAPKTVKEGVTVTIHEGGDPVPVGSDPDDSEYD